MEISKCPKCGTEGVKVEKVEVDGKGKPYPEPVFRVVCPECGSYLIDNLTLRKIQSA